MQWNPGTLIRLSGTTTYYCIVEETVFGRWIVREPLTGRTTQADSKLFEFAGYSPSSFKVDRRSSRNPPSIRQLHNPLHHLGPPPREKGANDRPNHVLLVDDEELVLDSYQQMLQFKNLRTSRAINGVNALKVIMSQEVDAIICDWMMPTMAGDMFYLAVQKIRPSLCQRFIFITGYEGHPQLEKFLQVNQPFVLYKPVVVGKLLTLLNMIITVERADLLPSAQCA